MSIAESQSNYTTFQLFRKRPVRMSEVMLTLTQYWVCLVHSVLSERISVSMYVLPISSKSLVGKDPILLYDPIPLYTHVYTQKWNYTALLYYSIVHFKYVIDVLNMYMYILGMYLYCILNTHWCQMHTQTVFQLGGGLVPLASFQTVLYSQVGLSGNPS